MSRILFVNLRSHLVERMEPLYAAKKLGIEVVLLTDQVPNIDDGYIDPENYIVTDTYDMENALKKVVAYAQKKEINGVLTWADKDVELVSLIADKLHIPAPTIEASKIARNKLLMREAISKTNPDLCPKYESVKSIQDLDESVRKIGFPAVLKPVGASGSKSIIKLNNKSEIPQAVERLKQETNVQTDKVYQYFPNQYIYEELLTGAEISIEGFVSSKTGEIIIAGMTDKFVTDKYSTEYLEYEPSQKEAVNLQGYRQDIKRAIKSMGITSCSFHAECKVNAGSLKVIEIAARPGGEFITSHLVKIASGISFVEQNIKNALGMAIDAEIAFENWSKTPKSLVVHQDFMANKEGRVVKIGGLQRIFEDPNVINFMPLKEVGDRVILPPLDYSSLYTATMIVTGKSLGELDSALERIENKFEIKIVEE
ncbi:ATP-grasp domain-containing protein [Lactobacillus sp. DCY120]|uniref:ATP-grasp domain-containing protein n=1 Tax=Bombilactobacillus apium TaxID=2675299 RepID=A0A850R441_9LACO|nr:ATP-grasp domain-containing protein [Bombilactobacillus apium]NVY96741.1 ATP-grasp domain-containing protein [Bombilactobacillus apium]